jgi:transcriptional regulator with XRE-family HTH domain
MVRSSQAREVGEFLRVRRAQLTPADVGLPEAKDRRVPGLRREEVAQLAAISADYYTRIEQGRSTASASVLAALARALRLDADEQAYVYELAGKPAAFPAMLASRTLDVLAWNPIAAALMLDFGEVPIAERNYLRLLFTHPRLRRLYVDWEEVARTSVAYLRMEAAHAPDDPRLAQLVGELSVRDPHFRRWWAGHHVATKRRGTRRFQHPEAGRLELEWDTLTWDADPDQHLIIYTAEPGSPSETALRRLAQARPWEAPGSGAAPVGAGEWSA